MPELPVGGIARRTPILPAGVHDALSPASVAVLGPAARFVLRLDPEAAARLGAAGGFPLSGALNTCLTAGPLTAARIGPDEWLLIGPEADGAALSAAIETALADTFHALVDVSHRNAGLTVSGASARLVLNAGIARDLEDAAFPAGSATRTLFGKADVVLLRPGQAPAYRVECWRSFAPYVFAYLTEVAQEFTA